MAYSASPRTNRSMKAATGSQQFAMPPPAMTIGSDSQRSAERIFRPAKSSIFRTFVQHSSVVILKPMTSKFFSGAFDSRVNRGIFFERRIFSASSHGAKARSAATFGR